MKTKSESALTAAKAHRAQAHTAVQVAAVSASADVIDIDVCRAHVVTLKKKRIGAIASNKLNSVISIDGELLRARVAVEIAAAKSATSTARHSSAVAALRDAETAVTQAAKALIDAESIALATKITAAIDDVLALGAELEALSSQNLLNTSLSAGLQQVPVEVTRALERLPKRNPYDIPVNELRGGPISNAWARRFAELTADDEIDVSVAA